MTYISEEWELALMSSCPRRDDGTEKGWPRQGCHPVNTDTTSLVGSFPIYYECWLI